MLFAIASHNSSIRNVLYLSTKDDGLCRSHHFYYSEAGTKHFYSLENLPFDTVTSPQRYRDTLALVILPIHFTNSSFSDTYRIVGLCLSDKDQYVWADYRKAEVEQDDRPFWADISVEKKKEAFISTHDFSAGVLRYMIVWISYDVAVLLSITITSIAQHRLLPRWSRRDKTDHSQLSMSQMGPLSTPWSVEETEQRQASQWEAGCCSCRTVNLYCSPERAPITTSAGSLIRKAHGGFFNAVRGFEVQCVGLKVVYIHA